MEAARREPARVQALPQAEPTSPAESAGAIACGSERASGGRAVAWAE